MPDQNSTSSARIGGRRSFRNKSAIAFGLSLFISAAGYAQDISTYPTVMNPENFSIDWETFYIEATEMTQSTQDRVAHTLDLSYGADPKQKLDLYFPSDPGEDTPILLLLHGGGFMEGDKSHYGYLAESFTKKNIAVAVASYRLAGDDGFSFPAQLDDAKQALLWLHEHGGEYDYNGDLLFVGGHSAGAMLAAEAAGDRRWLAEAGLDKTILRGAIPISGTYDLRERGLNAFMPTESARIAASASLNIVDPAPAFLVALGGEESANKADSLEFSHRLLYEGVRTQFLELEDADHKEVIEALADENSPMFIESLRLIQSSVH